MLPFDFSDMIDEFGVDLTVYPYQSPAKKPHFHYVAGEPVADADDTTVKPEHRHEPVVPFNANDAMMAQLFNGGEVEQADLLWISTKLYPTNTIVEVPSQPGEQYRVIDHSNFGGYTDPGVVIYELKGDDKHPNGR